MPYVVHLAAIFSSVSKVSVSVADDGLENGFDVARGSIFAVIAIALSGCLLLLPTDTFFEDTYRRDNKKALLP